MPSTAKVHLCDLKLMRPDQAAHLAQTYFKRSIAVTDTILTMQNKLNASSLHLLIQVTETMLLQLTASLLQTLLVCQQAGLSWHWSVWEELTVCMEGLGLAEKGTDSAVWSSHCQPAKLAIAMIASEDAANDFRAICTHACWPPALSVVHMHTFNGQATHQVC